MKLHHSDSNKQEETTHNNNVAGTGMSGKNLAAIMVVYLLGVFMGSVDTGIVTPARTVIQSYFGVEANLGIWMITIYTLGYAASIPIMGKLADKHGRKPVFLACIALFGLGSLACGLSEYTNNFAFLLIARAAQAIGGGGIMPVANAEFGTAFPPEKRGMALGMVGGIYGLANIIGASFGSAILDIFGQDKWSFIFYFNVPIALVVIVVGLAALPNNKTDRVAKTDFLGSAVFVVIIMAVLYALKNMDFFDFIGSMTSVNVWPFLLCAVALWPLFVFIEHKAQDPILNLSYFHNVNICLVMVMGILTGIIMMGMVFVPQFSENVMRMASGSGGYYVLVIGLTSAIGAPMSGKIIDKYGAKIVLTIGFGVSAIGGAFLAFVTASYTNIFTIIAGLLLAGIGLGFVMGTPLNYMMLENTKAEDSNSALATLSLVRSIGTIIAPAIMVGFLSHAGMAYQQTVMDYLPDTIDYTDNAYVVAVNDDIDTLRQMPGGQAMVDSMDQSAFTMLQPITIDMNNRAQSMELPDEVVQRLSGSDVTTIADDCSYMADTMFDTMLVSEKQQAGKGIQKAIEGVEAAQAKMPPAAASSLDALHADLQALNDNLDSVFNTAKSNYLKGVQENAGTIEESYQQALNGGFSQVYLCVLAASIVGLLLLVPYRSRKQRAKLSAA